MITNTLFGMFSGFCFGCLIGSFLLYRSAKKMLKKGQLQAQLVLEAQGKGHLLRVITNVPIDQEESA